MKDKMGGRYKTQGRYEVLVRKPEGKDTLKYQV
jgi:hypothetical protein